MVSYILFLLYKVISFRSVAHKAKSLKLLSLLFCLILYLNAFSTILYKRVSLDDILYFIFVGYLFKKCIMIMFTILFHSMLFSQDLIQGLLE